jgi:cytoskeletal protein RodZ
MRSTDHWYHRVPAALLVVALGVVPFLQEVSLAQQNDTTQAPASQQQVAPQDQTQPPVPPAPLGDQANPNPATTPEGGQPLPDSPGSVTAQPATNGTPQTSPQPSRPQAQPTPPAGKPQPVGTAAAEGISPSGTAASEPAGVAVAPAKQHQKRNLLIALGAIAGGAVALGAVVALSKASPSVPPGAR